MEHDDLSFKSPTVIIIGGGPAGLMAADVLSAAGVIVQLYDAMPSVGRKFLMAGRGGLNLTHSEPLPVFLARYLMPKLDAERWLDEFSPTKLIEWAGALGIETFIGSSGRVFPREMKASPLLRAWLKRLTAAGVRFHLRHRWLGWNEGGSLRFETPDGSISINAPATILALGGGSWARLGSDGKWLPILAAHGVQVQPLRPANCGFDVTWSEHLRTRFAGTPVKAVIATVRAVDGTEIKRQGDFVISGHGVEGGLIYALAAPLRELIELHGEAFLQLDLAPGLDVDRLTYELSRERGRDSLANHLRRRTRITGAKAALIHEYASAETMTHPAALASLIKSLPLRLIAPRPLDEAISSAGGVDFSAVNGDLMLLAQPGVFVAGEMLDWEAPTGGYLLTACFASGRIAARGALHHLGLRPTPGKPC